MHTGKHHAKDSLRWRGLAGVAAVSCALTTGTPVFAEEHGFRLDRYESTTAGSWLFLVDRPWYSDTHDLAFGLSLGYAHDALRFPQMSGAESAPVVAHSLQGYID